jgi:hypothetical protein
MAQTEEEKLQASLFAQLEKEDVKVSGEAAEKMKENIEKASTGQAWLGLGVHDVFIQSIELTQAKTGTLGLKFTVHNDEGQAEVTKWLSEGALPYTIENVSRLVVHNTPEEKKAEARNFMSNVVSAKDLVAIAKEKLIEGVAVLQVREARDGSTYTNKDGEEKPSIERDLLSYKPKETKEQQVANLVSRSKEATPAEKLDIPF